MPDIHLEITDLTLRFLDFYERARAEDANPKRRWELWALTLLHELAHAVHMLAAGLPDGWERPTAELVLEEGLVTRITAELVPSLPPEAYVGYEPVNGTSD